MGRLAACGAALAAALGGVALVQAGRLRRAMRLVRQEAAQPLQRHRPGAAPRILLLGDSTGVGVGCQARRQSIAAHLARDWPHAHIVNASASGARVRDTLALVRGQAARWPRFDVVLLQVGGNDVLRLAPLGALERQLRALLAALRPVAARVVWVGQPNVGCAPLFVPPFNWLLCLHARRCARLFERCAREAGADVVDFFREPRDDPFSADWRRFYARDGIHPSAEAYGYCYHAMRPVLLRALDSRAI